MKFFVTGVNGQLGHDVMNELGKRGYEGIGSGQPPQYIGILDESYVTKAPYVRLDITDREQVFSVLKNEKPDVVIHCAAWTAVDLAEEKQNIAMVRAVNAEGTRNIAEACKKLDCTMTYISTDYIFNGKGNDPWMPENQDFNPLNFYGQTKLEGELAVSELLKKYFIVRTSWLYGHNGLNFVETMLKLGQTYDSVRVVNDQIGRPTYSYDLARLLVDLNETAKYGIYHATNEGYFISWYEFACEIFKEAGYDTCVIPETTEEYGRSIARRPKNSRLDTKKLINNGFCPLPDWKDALKRYLQVIKQQ
jgi:dTDP-4-dehydrorhamnose reductase